MQPYKDCWGGEDARKAHREAQARKVAEKKIKRANNTFTVNMHVVADSLNLPVSQTDAEGKLLPYMWDPAADPEDKAKLFFSDRRTRQLYPSKP
jgi:hypothetical protein